MKARLAVLATMCVALALSACKGPTSLKARLSTSTDSLTVYALSGTPPSYPSGVSLTGRQVVRVDGFASFDIALDIDGNGNAVIYPVKLVVSTPGGARPVGLQVVGGGFESVTTAPATGFERDSALVVTTGQVVAIQSPHNVSGDICQYAISPYLYAKIAVDSVNLASRTLFVRVGFDPNCGFRSFVDGVPTS
ncbi:MAG: hypothetical protein ACR2NS_14445 [Gemmatimonadaceae bacterium]